MHLMSPAGQHLQAITNFRFTFRRRANDPPSRRNRRVAGKNYPIINLAQRRSRLFARHALGIEMGRFRLRRGFVYIGAEQCIRRNAKLGQQITPPG
jgi:hypothetical protein